MFRNNRIPKLEQINCIFDNGGMGDLIASMPAIKYIRDYLKHVQLHLYVADYSLELAKNLVPNISIRPFSQKEKFNKDLPTIHTSCKEHDNMSTHLTDHAFHVLVNKQVPIEFKNYCKLNTKKINLNKFSLPEKYIVVTTGFTARVREWLPKSINETIEFIKSNGYDVIFLGSNSSPVQGMADAVRGNFNNKIDFSKGISLINKTSLLESAGIINNSKGIIGIDNGLLHLAGCTEIPIIGGFTTVNPLVRMPYRHNQLGWNFYSVVPEDSLECKFCQSEWNLLYDFDFRFCFYEDYKCKIQLTSEKFIDQLKKIL